MDQIPFSLALVESDVQLNVFTVIIGKMTENGVIYAKDFINLFIEMIHPAMQGPMVVGNSLNGFLGRISSDWWKYPSARDVINIIDTMINVLVNFIYQ